MKSYTKKGELKVRADVPDLQEQSFADNRALESLLTQILRELKATNRMLSWTLEAPYEGDD